jgi:hypothetical protein
VVGHYESFFITSAGASAAILGLLVVAVSVVNADDANPTTRDLRTVLAGSAFVALVDIFIVSIVTLTGGSFVFGLSSLAMAAVGLLATRGLIPIAKRAGNFSRSSRTRTLNIAFAAISAGGYSVQLGLAVALLANTQNAALQRALVLVIVALYCSALGRAWVVTGIIRRVPVKEDVMLYRRPRRQVAIQAVRMRWRASRAFQGGDLAGDVPADRVGGLECESVAVCGDGIFRLARTVR